MSRKPITKQIFPLTHLTTVVPFSKLHGSSLSVRQHPDMTNALSNVPNILLSEKNRGQAHVA